MPTFASLFTGGGLADIGAMNAGYTLLWGVEYDPAIAAVANANLQHRDTVHAASVVGFDWGSVERPDHLHMSPPCQDFSVAKTSGKVGNDNDALADACIEALRELEPSTVTLENVEGYRKAKGFQRIVDYLWGAGYWVNVDVLNSADMGVPQTRRRLILRAVRGGFPGPLPQPVKWRGWYEAIEDLIPELPETQFAAWQLERLPKELKEVCYIEQMNLIRPATVRAQSEPATLVTATQLRRPISSPKAYIVHNNDMRTMPIRAAAEPMFTVMAGSGIKNPSTAPKAYLVESKNANQQYGDGVRESHQPHTTVITDHKPSHQPKELLVDGIANEGTRVTSVDGDTPSFTIKASASKQASRAFIGTSEEEREEFEYQERLRWADEDLANAPKLAGRVVRMTPRCLARFQSVPDDYVLPEKTALACKIIGNGVPCLMMQRVMESFS